MTISSPTAFQSTTVRPHISESCPLLGSPLGKKTGSIFNGWKLSLNNTGRKAQRFLSKLTCGLIRDPYRCRKTSDFMSVKRSPPTLSTFVQSPDLPGLNAMRQKPDGLENIAVPPDSLVEEMVVSLMKENRIKQTKLGILLATRLYMIQATEQSYKYCEETGHKLHDPVRKEFAAFKGTSAWKIWTSDLSRYTSEELFFALHFATPFSPYAPGEGKPPSEEITACKKQMEETYFDIFDELLTLVAEKKCDTSKCHEIFLELRKNAFRDALWKSGKDLGCEQTVALMQKATKDFLSKTSKLEASKKNNPLFLRAAHNATPLKPLPGMAKEFIDSVNQSVKSRAPSSFLLSRMACELILLAQRGDPAALSPCSPGAVLSPRTTADEIAIKREGILADIVARIGKATSADGNLGDDCVHVRTSKETKEVKAVRKIAELFKRNQTAFLARMAGCEECENARSILSVMHYGMPPLSEGVVEGDFPDKRYLDILKQAQTLLSERMIAIDVENKIGVEQVRIPSGKIEALFCKYFQEEAAGALRGFMQTSPDFLEVAPLSVDMAVREFEQVFEGALAKIPVSKDYVNDRLLVAHRAVQLLRSDMSGLDDRVFQSFEHAMRPSVLLARASQKVIEEISRTASEEAEKATEQVRQVERKGMADITVAGRILAELEQDRKAG